MAYIVRNVDVLDTKPSTGVGIKVPFDGSTGKTPISEESSTIPSSVTKYLEGRKPFLSRIAPIFFPSVKHIAEGPSHGSM